MTAPERIWIDTWGGKWASVAGGTQEVEYIRADLLDAYIGAALAEAAEYMSNFPCLSPSGLLPKEERNRQYDIQVEFRARIANAILARRPDALTALDRAKREAFEAGKAAALAGEFSNPTVFTARDKMLREARVEGMRAAFAGAMRISEKLAGGFKPDSFIRTPEAGAGYACEAILLEIRALIEAERGKP